MLGIGLTKKSGPAGRFSENPARTVWKDELGSLGISVSYVGIILFGTLPHRTWKRPEKRFNEEFPHGEESCCFV